MNRLWTGLERAAARTSVLLALLAAPLLLGGCGARLTVKNMTAHTLTPYPVVALSAATPRKMDLSGSLFHGQVGEIDRSGHDPIYYAHGISDPERANGLHLELDGSEEGSNSVRCHIVHFRVPPGEEGDDPEKAPIVLRSERWDLGSQGVPFWDRFVQITVTTDTDRDAGERPGRGGWGVMVLPGS